MTQHEPEPVRRASRAIWGEEADRAPAASSLPAERRVLDAIDIDALIECLCGLIPFRSVGDHETPIQEHVASLMEDQGLDVDVWDIDLVPIEDLRVATQALALTILRFCGTEHET